MKIKEFLKSKTLKCIVVLTIIALVSGVLLAVSNDLLAVSDEERVLRTIKKIYGEEIGYEEIEVVYQDEKGEIERVYKLDDGNYLVRSKGKGGYPQGNGTVTVWAVAKYDQGNFVGIDDVSIADNEKQTLMSKFTSAVLDGYEGKNDDNNVIVSGATFTSTAVNNAVNTAVRFFNENGGEL